jgi:hypothetical protein
MDSVTVDFDVEKVEPHPESKRFKEEQDKHREEKEEEDEERRSSGKGGHGESFEWV